MVRNSSFQDRFCELLSRSPKSDLEIANELGVSKQAVSSWKNGKRSPGESMIKKIAHLFGVDIIWLMGFDQEAASISDQFREKARFLYSTFSYDDKQAAIDNGMDIGYLVNVINSTGHITLDAACKVCDILGESISDMLNLEDENNSQIDEFIRRFTNLPPDRQSAILAAMKAFAEVP